MTMRSLGNYPMSYVRYERSFLEVGKTTKMESCPTWEKLPIIWGPGILINPHVGRIRQNPSRCGSVFWGDHPKWFRFSMAVRNQRIVRDCAVFVLSWFGLVGGGGAGPFNPKAIHFQQGQMSNRNAPVFLLAKRGEP